MTTNAQGNAVCGDCVIFAIINMVNFLSVFTTHCTGVIVAAANHIFELGVEFGRIWLKRLAALPEIRFLSIESGGSRTAGRGAVLAIAAPSIKEGFTAILTFIFNFAAFPKIGLFSVIINIFGAARRGTIATLFGLRRMKAVMLSAITTDQFHLTALPLSGLFSCFVTRPTGIGAIKAVVLPIGRYKIFFPTMLTDFLYFHLVTLKGASCSASQYCCSRNTGQTGSVLNKNLTYCVA